MIPFEQLTKADIRLVQAGMNALLRREVALKIDGIWGPASRAAYDDYMEPSVYTGLPLDRDQIRGVIKLT